MSASLIFGAQSRGGEWAAPHAFLFGTCATRGGLILRPGPTTKILCACAADAGATCEKVQTSLPTVAPTDFPGDGCSRCKWAPALSPTVLHRVTKWQHNTRRAFYNEYVMSASHWRAHVPDLIEATFGSSGEKARRELISHFGARIAQRVPHVQLRGDNAEQPFADVISPAAQRGG